ncbi:monoamine oxidase [Brasilonema octagenarum UFV-E1]|uniref:Monoamine oxidase n=1 Tax=Brasilonema sennae CENA114 TaxID=415709 RepID=A0A856MM85_9CYAN|nr:NAD(P)/FAD-dependent oxidoreductase [Brasilonema sennae]QDL10641.1 monoamine oxidase [Brasilonema sennae CENA114]QDL16988.1 monoamine oxidase [Brasilonema octagenarum UFV-E1]
MTRSALMALLRRAYKITQVSLETGIPTDEIVEIFHQKTTRRRLIYGGLGLASAISAVTWDDGGDSVAYATIPKVLVVGAGIAGLVAAYRLSQAGVPVDIVEARNRIGGRIYTLQNALGTSIPVDLGGEFIDTNHTSLRSLAQELGLQIADLSAADKDLIQGTLYFQGRKISEKEILQWFTPLVQKIKRDLAAIGKIPVTYRTHNQVASKLDNTSITQYLEEAQVHPLLSQRIQVAYTGLYGREAREQSSLNMLLFIGTDPKSFQISAESDERYQIVGGNDQIPRLLARILTNSIETGTELEAIATRSDGSYRVSLRSGNRSFERTYERVLLALPFSTLRQVSLNVDLPAVKKKAIAQLGYGNNAKLITAYQERIWRTRYNSTAFVSSDLDFQSIWEASRYQPGSNGLLTNFTGGQSSLLLGQGSAESQAQKLLTQLEKIFPGIPSVRKGEAIRAYWPTEPYTRASYACYLIGQWTTIAGSEQENVGNLFFAGEHCSQKFQGYMEGGCRTGEMAAVQILRSLGLKKSAAQQQARMTRTRGVAV